MAQFNFASPTVALLPLLNYPECPGRGQVRPPLPVGATCPIRTVRLYNSSPLYYPPFKLQLNQMLSS